ncbi:MAG: MBL fold metallo-hydrolase [Acidilobaceae archaeon]|nr:MBL fold metallo-hydrolase [Acidilobaceae archaeon]MCX8165247.1 MBL fold metallo-hydrolase [Acidilobaceae archaeon]MDW7973673.1 MBL fold metallo-hydrolase [Sulfolobales archaeon]
MRGLKFEILDATPLGGGFSSVYLVKGEKAALIDAGPANGGQKVLEALRALGEEIHYVVLTHVHIDHGGAAGILSSAFNAEVYVHPRGARHIVDTSMLWEQSRQALGPVAEYYGEPTRVEGGKVRIAEHGESLDLGGLKLRFLHTPGHASHHMSVLVGEVVVAGDSAGVVVDGSVRVPTTPFPFKPKQYIESIEVMERAGPQRVYLSHFGLAGGAEYLAWHKEEIVRWLDSVAEMVRRGVTDAHQVGELLAERLENAKKARESRISHLYYNTVAGLTRAVLEGEWP